MASGEWRVDDKSKLTDFHPCTPPPPQTKIMTNLNNFLNFALDAAWQAGRVTRGYFQTGVAVQQKADNTPLTIADRQAEQKLRQLIGQQWPEHNIIGEEYGRAEKWQKLIEASYEQRTWGDAYGYALVATGRADVIVDPIMSLWDVAPMQVIMEEAGGTLTDWCGKATIHNEESIATNKQLLPDVMALLK
ncbi:hypothetical protein MNBD_CHLOROFLEXI01-2757 [hydrothermal vent metagenome]|uniref:Histidinol-phosphatase n=1 Tax=hydrothermal vent metagenome TaxID=652676 RepID=A0A3B0VIM2_9ZZZZ